MPAPGFSLPKNPVTRMYVDKGENAYLPEMDKYYQSKQLSTSNVSNNNNIELPVVNKTQTDVSSTQSDLQPTISNIQQAVSNLQLSTSNIEYFSGSKYYVQGETWNWPLNSIVIKKTNAVTGELLAGASFELYRTDEQVSGVPGTSIGRYTTDNSGIVIITGLEPGYYVVKEVKAPQNFTLSENSQQNGFLKADGTSVLEFTFANYPYGAILITKVDGVTKEPLANAKFKVTDNAGKTIGNSNGEYTTNSKGEILINNVAPGSYVVTEIQAPDNYAVDSTPKTVEIRTDGKTQNFLLTTIHMELS